MVAYEYGCCCCCFGIVECELSSVKNQHYKRRQISNAIRWNGIRTRTRRETRIQKQLAWKDCFGGGGDGGAASRIGEKRKGYIIRVVSEKFGISQIGPTNEQMADVNAIHGFLSFVRICCRWLTGWATDNENISKCVPCEAISFRFFLPFSFSRSACDCRLRRRATLTPPRKIVSHSTH